MKSQLQSLKELLLVVRDSPGSGYGTSKPFDLRERTFLFARRVMEIVGKLPKTREGDVIRTQLLRSGTSIGANIEEADGAISKRDFHNKISIARKEAKETHYWLRLIADVYVTADEIAGDVQETSELIRIMSRILQKTK